MKDCGQSLILRLVTLDKPLLQNGPKCFANVMSDYEKENLSHFQQFEIVLFLNLRDSKYLIIMLESKHSMIFEFP